MTHILARAELLLQAKNYGGSGNWLDESGNGHDAVPTASPTFVALGPDSYFQFDGATQYFTILDDAGLDFDTLDDLSVLVDYRPADTTSTQALLVKATSVGASAGWKMYQGSGGDNVIFKVADGVASSGDTGDQITVDTRYLSGGVRNTSDDDVESFLDGVGTGTPNADATTLTLANAMVLRIAATSTPGDLYEGRIHAVVLWREALTDADVALAGEELRIDLPSGRRVSRSPRYGITRVATR